MSQDRFKEIQKSIILIQLMSAPANIAIGLGLYGIFVANGNAFISALDYIEFCYGLIIVGGLIEIVAVIKLLPLWKERSTIKNDNFKNT